jgi:hypothetical protein
MNRRTAIKGTLVVLVGCASADSLYKWFSLNSTPDLAYMEKRKALIAEIAETIIPRTNTPGAKDAKVEDFIVKMIKYCSDKKTQNKFIHGLADLESYSSKEYNHNFIQCTKSQRIQILQHFEEEGSYSIPILNKVNSKFMGMSFFNKMKLLTAQGYCTSEVGATKGLAYDYIPGQYQACIPIAKNQLSWATK